MSKFGEALGRLVKQVNELGKERDQLKVRLERKQLDVDDGNAICCDLIGERDELAAHAEFLTGALNEVLNKFAGNDSLHYYMNAINSTRAASLLLHDAGVLEEFLAKEAPRLNPEGLDLAAHHCEHTLYVERERLHESVAGVRKQAESES